MIHNVALRAIIAVAIFVAAWWLLGQVLLSMSWLTTLSLTIALLIALVAAVGVFIGLAKPLRQPQAGP